MALEIERKFLVEGDFMSEVTSSSRIVQGYLASSPSASVRVRIYGEKGYMTVKGRISQSGMSRFEWEKQIPVDEALSLLMLCGGGVIDKVRHIVPFAGHDFEVDVFTQVDTESDDEIDHLFDEFKRATRSVSAYE